MGVTSRSSPKVHMADPCASDSIEALLVWLRHSHRAAVASPAMRFRPGRGLGEPTSTEKHMKVSLTSSRGRPGSGHGSTRTSIRRRTTGIVAATALAFAGMAAVALFGDGGARPRTHRARRRRCYSDHGRLGRGLQGRHDHQRHDQLHPGPARDRWQPAGQQHRRRICQRWIAERDHLHRGRARTRTA